jgi:predicted AAA+ superfamily ATPase
MTQYETLIKLGEQLLARLDRLAPTQPTVTDWRAHAWRWRKRNGSGALHAIRHPQTLRLADLRCIDDQKTELDRNTRQFLQGLPANNALLWGARGTGKSSLIKALLHEHARDGLRLIEIDRVDLIDLPDILDLIYDRPEHFILFCDDLSFETGDASYKTLKAALDGQLSAAPDKLLIYASSNRRHLLPETMQDNLDSRFVADELHPSEAIEEKISLSERFGIWLSFHPFTQDEYLDIVFYWLKRLRASLKDRDAVRREALRWALTRGSRSGRVAWQFARDWVGREGLKKP